MRKLDFDEFDKLYNEDIEARHRWKKEKLAKQKKGVSFNKISAAKHFLKRL